MLMEMQQKYQCYKQKKVNRCEYLVGRQILPLHEIKIIKQVTFIYFLLGKAFKRQKLSNMKKKEQINFRYF